MKQKFLIFLFFFSMLFPSCIKTEIVPDEIDGAKVLFYVKIGVNQKHTGKTKSYVKGKLMGASYGLAICQYEGKNDFYLFDCNEKWETINDTFHETIEGAKAQAEFEYENTINNWIEK